MAGLNLLPVIPPLLALQGCAVAIRRDDGTEFLACAAPGIMPAVWTLAGRKFATAHARELRGQGFSCRVVRVWFADVGLQNAQR